MRTTIILLLLVNLALWLPGGAFTSLTRTGVCRTAYQSVRGARVLSRKTLGQGAGMRLMKQWRHRKDIRIWKRYVRKERQYHLYVKLKEYQFTFGAWLKIRGVVSGSLNLKVKRASFTDYKAVLKNLLFAEGKLHFSTLDIPFYGEIRHISIDLNQTGQGTTQFSGSIKSRVRLLGTISKGKMVGKAVFRGINLSSRLPVPYSRLFTVTANGAVDFSLTPKLRSDITLDGLLAVANKRGRHGEYLVMRNRDPVRLSYFAGKIHLLDAALTFGRSLLTVKGHATKKLLAFTYHATGDIASFSPWIPGPVSRFRGPFVFDGAVSGTLKHPMVNGLLSMSNGKIYHEKGKHLFTINSLGVVFDHRAITLHGAVHDALRRPLILKGRVGLLSYFPQEVELTLKGALPGEILQDLSDIHVTAAEGSGDIDLSITGDFFTPLFKGTFRPRRITLRPRGVYKNISITSGVVRFKNKDLYVQDMKATYDGSIINIDGHLTLQKNFYCNLIMKGINIPFRKAKDYHGELSPTVTLSGYRDTLKLSGKLDIITGKYVRKFDIIKKIITIHRFRERSDPIWKHYPWMGKMVLDLSILNSGDLEVENNIADLSLDGVLALKGTLSKPRMTGAVNVNYGTFKIPFLKGTYEVFDGTVNFDKGPTPFLKLSGNTTVENIYGEEVLVTLNLEGPLDKIRFSIKSFPELDQGEIVMLLASGRTTSDLRRLYHGDPRGGTGTSSSSYNPVYLYDEPIKQITGDFFSELISSPIKMVTKLDLIRFELGSDSFQLKLSKKFLKRIKLMGEFELGFMGQNRQEGGLEVKFHDRLYLDSKIRRYEPGINEYIYETPLKGKIELKYKLMLRGNLRDILGL